MTIDPLIKGELRFVGNILDKYGNDNSIFDVSALDGFLTAIVSGPEMIMPSEWIPALWGGPGNEPEWESEDEFQRFFRLVMQHMNYIATMLMDHPEEFEALYLQAEMNGKTYNIVGEWCEGYLKDVSLSSNAWLQLPKRIIENHLSVMQIFASDEHIDELSSYRRKVF